jgi:hypothetical protein
MLKLLTLFKRLSEGIQYSDETYSVDYNNDLMTDLIRFTDRLSVNKDIYGDIVLIGIPIQKSENKSILMNHLKTNKGLSNSDRAFLIDRIKYNLEDYEKINEYDYVISPRSSSTLTKEFIESLKIDHPNTTFISDMFLKNSIEKIWVDVDTAKQEKPHKFVKKLIKRFEQSKGLEGQSMKLQPLNNYERKYIRDMIVVNPGYQNILSDMSDKKILIIDDILTSGKTLNDIKLLLTDLNIGNITLFTMFG